LRIAAQVPQQMLPSQTGINRKAVNFNRAKNNQYHRPLTNAENGQWSGAVLVNGGGCQAAKAAIAAKRKSGQRGAQRSPVKQLPGFCPIGLCCIQNAI